MCCARRARVFGASIVHRRHHVDFFDVLALPVAPPRAATPAMCVSRRKPGTREIPVIDLGLLKTDRAAFVQAVGAALEDIGFFALEGHGVSSAAIDGAYAEGQAFFARPLGEKLAFDATRRRSSLA